MNSRLPIAMLAVGLVACSAIAAQTPQAKPADEAKAKGKTVEWNGSKDDPAKLRERITHDMQSAEHKLLDNDPGRETRQVQERILTNIDKLIDLARNPPPSSPDSSPQGGVQPPSGASQPQGGSQSRRERREQQGQTGQQSKAGPTRPSPCQPRPTFGQGQTTTGQTPNGGRGQPVPDGMADKFGDVVKDIWGHLPDSLRQEVDHYYRDQFMPRYRDLLQQYYSRLAERDRNRGGDR